jgi:hypothetical protein
LFKPNAVIIYASPKISFRNPHLCLPLPRNQAAISQNHMWNGEVWSFLTEKAILIHIKGSLYHFRMIFVVWGLILAFFHVDYFTAFIKAAIGANGMR